MIVTSTAVHAPWCPEDCPGSDDFIHGPAPWSVLSCGCHLRRPDYQAVLCPEHEAEVVAEVVI